MTWMVNIGTLVMMKPPYDLRLGERSIPTDQKRCFFSDQVKEKGLLYFRKPDVNHEEGFEVAESLGVQGEGLGPVHGGGRIWLLWFGYGARASKGTIENTRLRTIPSKPGNLKGILSIGIISPTTNPYKSSSKSD